MYIFCNIMHFYFLRIIYFQSFSLYFTVTVSQTFDLFRRAFIGASLNPLFFSSRIQFYEFQRMLCDLSPICELTKNASKLNIKSQLNSKNIKALSS